MALVGCGGIARHHLKTLLQLKDLEITTLVDPDPKQRAETLRQFPSLEGIPWHNFLAEAIERGPNFEAVHLNTPHSLHFGDIELAFVSGMHVWTEKPLTTTIEDCKKAMEARDRCGRVGLLGYQRHYQGVYRAVRDRVVSGDLGAVRYCSALLCQEWKRFTTGLWRQIPEISGGGMLLDSGSHMIDALLWATGLRAESVSAFLDYSSTPVEINSTVNVRFHGGALGSLAIMGDAPTWKEEVTIWCENGAIFVREDQAEEVMNSGERRILSVQQSESTSHQNFADAILRGAPVESPFECGLSVLELTEGAYRSGLNGGMTVNVS